MSKQNLLDFRNFLDDLLQAEGLSETKKTEINTFIQAIDKALKKKDPARYISIILSAAQVAEFFKILLEFFQAK